MLVYYIIICPWVLYLKKRGFPCLFHSCMWNIAELHGTKKKRKIVRSSILSLSSSKQIRGCKENIDTTTACVCPLLKRTSSRNTKICIYIVLTHGTSKCRRKSIIHRIEQSVLWEYLVSIRRLYPDSIHCIIYICIRV